MFILIASALLEIAEYILSVDLLPILHIFLILILNLNILIANPLLKYHILSLLIIEIPLIRIILGNIGKRITYF